MAVTVNGGFFFFKCSDKEIAEMKAANNTREKKPTFGTLQQSCKHVLGILLRGLNQLLGLKAEKANPTHSWIGGSLVV
jgi:hypothetical protein